MRPSSRTCHLLEGCILLPMSTTPHRDLARRAIEEVCARGDFANAPNFYSPDFHDHVNSLEYHGLDGVRKSVSLYRSVLPDLDIRVEEQVSDGDRVASRWVARLRAAFPGAQIAAVGFVPQSPGARISTRERGWNAGVLSTLRDADALTFHPYFQSGLAGTASLRSVRAATAMLLAPALRWGEVRASALAGLSPGMRAWLTEYNLFDRVAPAHTTWAQGLALDAYSLELAGDPRVAQADVHALVASAPFGALFADRGGLGFGSDASAAFNAPRGARHSTMRFGRSATGVAAAALLAAEQVESLSEGTARVRQAIQNGKARQVLERLIIC